jgi:hypothetical protein
MCYGKHWGKWSKAVGLGDEPRQIPDEIGKMSLVDVVLPTKPDTKIKKRCITQPTEHQKILPQYLKLNLPKQFNKK